MRQGHDVRLPGMKLLPITYYRKEILNVMFSDSGKKLSTVGYYPMKSYQNNKEFKMKN